MACPIVRKQRRARVERTFRLRDQPTHLEYALGQFLLFVLRRFRQQIAQLSQFRLIALQFEAIRGSLKFARHLIRI